MWQWITFATFFVAVMATAISASRRIRIRRLLSPDLFGDFSSELSSTHELYAAYKTRRGGDFFDRWADDLSTRYQSSGLLPTVGQGLWDIFTLGTSARRRQKQHELAVAIHLWQSMDGIMSVASDNIRQIVEITSSRINYAFQLLQHSQRMLKPVAGGEELGDSPKLRRRVEGIERKSRNLMMRHSAFVDIATAAGAGTATAVGLWGAVQLAGYASTGTAMGGLYGAAASNAGWAWFGGGSLATGGGGMALGHAVLPGVGLAVGYAVLVTRLHKTANEMEKQIVELENCNDANMLVLKRMVTVEQNYRSGAEDFRDALEVLHEQVQIVNSKLRPFGFLNDWLRSMRVARRSSYYSDKDMAWVDKLAIAVDRFLSRLPAANLD